MAPLAVFLTLRDKSELSPELADELREFVAALWHVRTTLCSQSEDKEGRFHITGRNGSLIL